MKKVKITVLRSTFNEDLARDYGMPGLKPCSMMKEGQVFYAGLGKPEGFCDGAWRTIHPYVFALANGAKHFYFNDWVRQPGVAITCCNDGLRPVFFKLETTDEEVKYWNIAYGRLPGEVMKDEEGVANMKNLGQNIAWLMNRIKE